MTDFVLDNSVAMRWCFEAGAHPSADALLRRLSQADRAVVPRLWRYEASAVLARAQISGALAPTKARDFLLLLGRLPIVTDADGDDAVLTDVHDLAVAERLTAYDAAYLELAIRRGLPLASFDRALVAAATRVGVALI